MVNMRMRRTRPLFFFYFAEQLIQDLSQFAQIEAFGGLNVGRNQTIQGKLTSLIWDSQPSHEPTLFQVGRIGERPNQWANRAAIYFNV